MRRSIACPPPSARDSARDSARFSPAFFSPAALPFWTLPLAALLLAPLPALSQEGPARQVESRDHAISIETVASGLVHPWGLDFLPDGRFLVTERNPGQLRVGEQGGALSDPVEGVPEIFRFEGETGRSQGGLFDVAVGPEGAGEDSRPYIYLSYSKPTPHGAAVAVTRARLSEGEGAPRLEEAEEIFVMKEADQDSSGLHFGGRLALDAENEVLYLTIGERRNISRAQDRQDQAGSTLRLGLDGSIPQDNPFVGEEADDAIYTWGNRNSQGLALRPEDGSLWETEHGPKGGDELNLLEAGKNYGWPIVSQADDYSGAALGEREEEGMTPPAHVFKQTVAPSGLAFYDGEMFSAWQGDLLSGSLSQQALVRLEMDGERVDREEMLDIGRRIRDVVVAEDGAVWLLTEHADGEVLRLTTGQSQD